jgi:hypothetical protein
MIMVPDGIGRKDHAGEDQQKITAVLCLLVCDVV